MRTTFCLILILGFAIAGCSKHKDKESPEPASEPAPAAKAEPRPEPAAEPPPQPADEKPIATEEVKYKAGDLEIDRYRFEARMKGRHVELTPKEFELLATLVGTPGRVFGREELLDMVWGRDGFVEPRTVDVHVARLRGKFSAAKLEEPGIETVRGVGYRFKDTP